MLLEKIKKASDVKKIGMQNYNRLAKEIREFLITKLSKVGGHLASNLGVVELTIALFASFDLPKDKIIWDVGHQSYTHKILSGRKDEFDELRKYKGIAGFPKTSESPCDAFNTGHSSTSISAGLGLVHARDLNREEKYIVSVIGDGALTGGMAYEALNNAARLHKNFIIVLNDNEMSISPNVGGMSNYLNSIRTGRQYNRFKQSIVDLLNKLPHGTAAIAGLKQTKDGIKHLLIPGMFFENMGITYLGPVDGHNIKALIKVFHEAKKLEHAVLVHVITKKGKGYSPAEQYPERFHGVSSFDVATGESLQKEKLVDYSAVFSETICKLGQKDRRIVAITAAMPEGTGLSDFSQKYPERFFDVGIAEQHALTMAAGMALGGLKPVVAVYSSFLQRAFDQIIHDICLQNLSVLIAVDRAGLVGADGETHQGIFDLSYLGLIPNMTVFAPKNADELREGMDFLLRLGGPCAIRYPRGKAYEGLSGFRQKIELGKAEMLYEEKDIALLCLGTMVSTGEHLREKLKADGRKVSLVNLRFAKPLDLEMLDRVAGKHKWIVTMEENVINGGIGVQIADYIQNKYKNIKIMHVGIEDKYVEHGDVSLLRKDLGLDSDSVYRRLKGLLS